MNTTVRSVLLTMDYAVKKSADITPIVIAVQIVPLMTAQDE